MYLESSGGPGRSVGAIGLLTGSSSGTEHEGKSKTRADRNEEALGAQVVFLIGAESLDGCAALDTTTVATTYLAGLTLPGAAR